MSANNKTKAQNKSAEVITYRPWLSTTRQRHLRLLDFILQNGSITRKEVDKIAPAANGPQEIADLRELGFELPCERVPHMTVDGKKSWYGRYKPTSADLQKAREVMKLTRRLP